METCVLFQDLRETIDKQSEQIRKLKKMLKIYAKKLKDGEGEQIDAFSFFFFCLLQARLGWCLSYATLASVTYSSSVKTRDYCARYIYIKNKECEEKKLL